jgi:serine/threonine protein kinase
MGSVYEVYDELLQRRLALKTLHAKFSDPALLERFLREGRALAALDHPNILGVFDIFEDNNGLNLLTPLVDGENLVSLIKKGPLPIGETARIIHAVAGALDYAHGQGLIHRDVKPSNILIDSSGRVILMDFGIAKLQGDRTADTRPGMVLGTPMYIAPETALGQKVDHRADIYALGLTAFEMLSGKPPFERDTDFAMMYAQVHEPPPVLTSLRADVPRQTAEAVTRALAKKPEDRFATAGAFADAAFPSSIERAGPMPRSESIFNRMLGRLGGLLKPRSESEEQKIPGSPSEAAPEDRPKTAPSQPAKALQQASRDVTRTFIGPPTQLLQSDSEHQSPVTPQLSERRQELTESAAVETGGESTRIFQAPTGNPVQEISPPPSPISAIPAQADSSHRPRVSLSFTACADPEWNGKSVAISSVPFVIGRSTEVDLSIPSEPVLSRKQCCIDWAEGAYILRDLGSRNHTWLNGRALGNSDEVLLFGSVIRFSSSTALTFVSLELWELPDLTGCVIDGRYKLAELLRSSSKSSLYRAEDLRLPRNVAAKILSPALAGYPGYLEQFNREAEMAARLRHPHIANVLDFGLASIDAPGGKKLEANYVCMEYMQGGSLAGRIAASKFLSPAEVIAWLNPVADALEYAHRNGIVHSGLKSNSIIFDEEGKPYLTDFTIATSPKDTTRRLFLGTPDFMAPEQWEGLEPTHATDQYALGALAYYGLTGLRPYEGQQDPETRQRNFARGAAPVHQEASRQGNAGVPEPVSTVIARAMAVKAADRYPSLHEFSAAFQSCLTGGHRKSGQPEIFLSYRRDAAAGWAALFSRELQQRGLSVFVDTQRRDNVVRFPAWLEKAIQECDVFVCLLAGNTLESAWVREEIRLAWHYAKPMVPVLQEDFKFPDASQQLEPHIDALLTYQGVSLLDRRGLYFDATIAELAKMIQATVGS